MLQKTLQAGAKNNLFLQLFFGETYFYIGRDAKNFFFFADKNTLCKELNIFANL